MTDKGQRIDKWLWFARIAKTRTLAARLVNAGRIRINRVKVTKPSTLVRPGDVITSIVGHQIRVLKILDLGARRGPASEASELHKDLTPPPEAPISGSGSRKAAMTFGARAPGTGRPTKRDRRLNDRWRQGGR